MTATPRLSGHCDLITTDDGSVLAACDMCLDDDGDSRWLADAPTLRDAALLWDEHVTAAHS